MSRKNDEPKKKKALPEDPLKHKALEALKSARDELAKQEEEAARIKKEAEERERQRRASLGLKQREPEREAKKEHDAPKPKKAADDVWRPDLDKELFAAAMAGVKPLEPSASRVSSAEKPAQSRDRVATKARRAAAEGDESIAVTWHNDGSCEAARAGRTFALQALGRFALVDEELDLHGLDVAAAQLRVVDFVRTRRSSGRKVVSIIHGVGKHSPDGKSVLRDVVVRALSEVPGCREVDAFCSAEPTSAGSAAILVALRAR